VAPLKNAIQFPESDTLPIMGKTKHTHWSWPPWRPISLNCTPVMRTKTNQFT
jgi:hypothetical protein